MKIGDTAPDFEAETTEGRMRFHDWIGDSWAVLFSHPKDFTPVCTTELGYMAKIKPEFDRRNVKVIGLSVDPTDKHEQWSNDIEETQGHAPNYPIIGDADFNVSKQYGMLPADTSGDPAARSASRAARPWRRRRRPASARARAASPRRCPRGQRRPTAARASSTRPRRRRGEASCAASPAWRRRGRSSATDRSRGTRSSS